MAMKSLMRPGHRPPQVVDDAENGVAVLHGVGDDAHGVEVVDLVDADALAQQFLVDAVEALDAAFDAAGDAGFFQAVAEHAFDARHEGFAGFAARLRPRRAPARSRSGST